MRIHWQGEFRFRVSQYQETDHNKKQSHCGCRSKTRNKEVFNGHQIRKSTYNSIWKPHSMREEVVPTIQSCSRAIALRKLVISALAEDVDDENSTRRTINKEGHLARN